MRYYSDKKQSGFTLLEILVTVSVIGVMGILISQVFFTTTKINTKTELLKDMKQNGQFAMDTLTRMIRASTEITSTCSTTGTQSTSIQITNPNGQTTTFGCALDSSGATRIASVSASATEYLTSQNVSLGGSSCSSDPNMSLSFVCTSYPDQPSRIKIYYMLRQIGSNVDAYQTAKQAFETTVSVRN